MDFAAFNGECVLRKAIGSDLVVRVNSGADILGTLTIPVNVTVHDAVPNAAPVISSAVPHRPQYLSSGPAARPHIQAETPSGPSSATHRQFRAALHHTALWVGSQAIASAAVSR